MAALTAAEIDNNDGVKAVIFFDMFGSPMTFLLCPYLDTGVSRGAAECGGYKSLRSISQGAIAAYCMGCGYLMPFWLRDIFVFLIRVEIVCAM